MANLNDNNRHNPRLRVNMGEYWDYTVCHDAFYPYSKPDGSLCENGLISYIDFSDPSCVDGDDWVYSKDGYSWGNALSIGSTLTNIGYTGIDNGLVRYRKDRISNKDFFDIFQKSKYVIEPDDYRLKLHAVSGTTQLYDYPLHVEDGQVKFNGGFYQGFYQTDCDKYCVMPSSLDDGNVWSLEFKLKKCDLEKESDKTLNDKYPENKGIFFYMGTRAENKWVYLYTDEDECFELSPDEYVEDAHIDKEEYIINNFFDLDVNFVEDPPYDIFEEYSNFEYREIIGYVPATGCTCIKPVYSEDSVEIGWCCDEPERVKYHLECKRKQCGCPKVCKKVPDPVDDLGYISGCMSFGDEYIDGSDIPDCDYDYVEPEIDISYFEYETDNGFKLSSPNEYYFYTDNKFMLFDRTKDGYKVSNWEEGTKVMYYGKKNKFKGNLFILMNRTQTGYTVNTIQKVIDDANNEYDSLYKDLFRNAFALRITDEGAIGYKYLIYDCDRVSEANHEYSIKEGYSNDGVIPDCEWVNIHVKIEGYAETMRLLFYIDGKLRYITDELPKFNFRKLDEINEKQEGVPFNMSLGGGTQGLAETIIRNYMLNPTRTYPLEKHFAGTFIGYMKDFRFYDGDLTYECIVNNAKI